MFMLQICRTEKRDYSRRQFYMMPLVKHTIFMCWWLKIAITVNASPEGNKLYYFYQPSIRSLLTISFPGFFRLGKTKSKFERGQKPSIKWTDSVKNSYNSVRSREKRESLEK